MDLRYELWHIESTNLMDDIADEAEARSSHGAELASLVFVPPHDTLRQSAQACS